MGCFRVVGHPIAHSLSPKIHAAFARQQGLVIDYQAELLPKDGHGFILGIQKLLNQGVQGFSVTLPFKQEAYALAEILTPRAERAKSVNTLWIKSGIKSAINPEVLALQGDNTDGAGFIQDLIKNQAFDLNQKRVLIIGSGGAVLGIMGPILDAGALVTLVSRGPLEASHPLNLWTHENLKLSFFLPESLQESEVALGFDLVINATSIGLEDNLQNNSENNLEKIFKAWSANWIGRQTLAYDLGYLKNNQPTLFMQWALFHGAQKAVDGFGMLLEQAALQFEIFTGILPEISEEVWRLRKD